ncbi:hypothetical protein HYPSUDRAFT_839498 [Hypholoma sublateritium FD-334 SS-4]|uniref:Uncharacterized protein n=1 Tax=Hypholoma sublateritium (strain FD-334 SS-4) TaxID=945553 RepID=A0A0D2NU50_HYPSF|nr:hypothetical protein HYPSUDRAFT_839498 [Hypholoma sublateritium FD-334 SS-4]
MLSCECLYPCLYQLELHGRGRGRGSRSLLPLFYTYQNHLNRSPYLCHQSFRSRKMFRGLEMTRRSRAGTRTRTAMETEEYAWRCHRKSCEQMTDANGLIGRAIIQRKGSLVAETRQEGNRKNLQRIWKGCLSWLKVGINKRGFQTQRSNSPNL